MPLGLRINYGNPIHRFDRTCCCSDTSTQVWVALFPGWRGSAPPTSWPEGLPIRFMARFLKGQICQTTSCFTIRSNICRTFFNQDKEKATHVAEDGFSATTTRVFSGTLTKCAPILMAKENEASPPEKAWAGGATRKTALATL